MNEVQKAGGLLLSPLLFEIKCTVIFIINQMEYCCVCVSLMSTGHRPLVENNFIIALK